MNPAPAAARKTRAAAQPGLKNKPSKPKDERLARAFQVVDYAHVSASSLLSAFNAVGKERGRGAPTTAQQDLLRAMLLTVGAGLDSCAKQLIEHALPALAAPGGPSRDELVTFAVRRLRKGEETSAALDAKFLVELMLGQPEKNLIRAFTAELTSSSSQSTEQLHRVAAALGVGSNQELKNAINDLQNSFKIRNKIAHEMDINFSSKGRNRTSRSRDPMVAGTNKLLTAADLLLSAVDAHLTTNPITSASLRPGAGEDDNLKTAAALR
jgi:hypothetical protein